jgi:hypothetical protein
MSTEFISLITTAAKAYRYGLGLQNTLASPNDSMDFLAGECVDDTGKFLMAIGSTFTKSLASTFVAGSGNGGLDAGSLSPNTTYHGFVIRKKSDGSIDGLWSTSATSPAMPTGWTAKRRVGACVTDGSGHILPCFWRGRRVYFKDVQVPIENVQISGAGAQYTLSGPAGVKHIAFGVISPGLAQTGIDLAISIVSALQAYQTLSAADPARYTFRGIIGGYQSVGQAWGSSSYFEAETDTSAQIKMIRSGSYDPSDATTLQQWGWEELEDGI